jgi:hypothetical protein
VEGGTVVDSARSFLEQVDEMPLPLAHSAIGFVTTEFFGKNQSLENRWKRWVFVVVLANLPDLDMLAGLLFRGDGNAFHRGPTHSLLFALAMGWVASNAWRHWLRDETFSFPFSVGLILSHVLADALFTTSPVSFLWPLEVYWSTGQCGWLDVIDSLLFQTWSDIGLVLASATLILCSRLVRYRVFPRLSPRLVRVMTVAGCQGSKSTS